MLVMAKISRKYYKYGLYGLVALVVLGVAGREVLIYRQKAEFGKAEKEIDALYAQIVEKVGKPDQEKKEKSCNRPNLKFEKGPLSCFVASYLLYENKNLEQSNNLMVEISSLGNQPLRIGSVSSQANAFTYPPRRNGDQVFFQSLGTKTPLSCTFSYVYPAKEQDEFKLNSETGFEIGIDCGGPAILEYFPVKKY